jgi:hypothetical protein
MNPIFADVPTTVFEVMSRLARETRAVNLGQGFPEDPGRRISAARLPKSSTTALRPSRSAPSMRSAR